MSKLRKSKKATKLKARKVLPCANGPDGHKTEGMPGKDGTDAGTEPGKRSKKVHKLADRCYLAGFGHGQSCPKGGVK